MAARLRRLIADAPASDAIPYRAAIMATVLISIVAAMTQEAVPRSVGVVSVAVIPFGFVFSYVRRGSRNVLLKFGLAGALFLAFAGFLSGVRGAATIDETRLPLATLFVWVQVLHSVDVPRRRDLGFSFAASIALISLAGSLAISSGFGFVVIAYAVAAGASLALRHLAELHEQAPGAAPGRTEPGKRPRTSGVLRPLAGVVAATVVCTTVAFVALPRFPGISVASLPIAIARRTPVQGFTGGVLNPGTRGDPSRGRGSGGGPESNFARDAYMGYGDDLNLRVRGRLSDTLVMRVRSPEPALWRAQVFDSYSDGRWTSSDKDTDTVRSFGSSINIPPSPELDRSFGRRDREVVQTFFIERQLPNLIFHAYEPREVFVPESSVQVDDFQSIRVPFILEPDTIYSVISEVPAATPEDLRLSPPPDLSDPRLTRYLEVPGSLSGRFRELAMQVTSGQQTSYDKVQAVENWLKRTKRYKIDIPPDPPGRDPVDVFVFDRHEGFCEQIAATMSLMLRASGVPSRIATGFGEGERNPFTGYWEVKNSDAHAWVEVFYPDQGWIPYDPTFGVPEASPSNTTFMLEPLARAIGRVIPAGAVVRLTQGLRDALGIAAFIPLLVVAAGVPATFVMRRRRRHRRTVHPGPRGRVVEAWLSLEDALAAVGLERMPHETVREFLPRAAAHPSVDAAELRRLADTFSRVRYGREPGEREAAACEQAAWRIRDALRGARPPVFSTSR